ncbi:MAG: hypothetical protein V4671_20195 [Armatimonadota bacterium]
MSRPTGTPNTTDADDVPAGMLSLTELQILLDAALANKDRPNGIKDDQLRHLFAVVSRRPDPVYQRMLEEGIAEYRREIQDDLERELAEGGQHV